MILKLLQIGFYCLFGILTFSSNHKLSNLSQQNSTLTVVYKSESHPKEQHALWEEVEEESTDDEVSTKNLPLFATLDSQLGVFLPIFIGHSTRYRLTAKFTLLPLFKLNCVYRL